MARRAEESLMFTFETSDQKEVRRYRIAQFNGRAATVRSGQATVTGHVRAVQEKEHSIPPCWTITIIPNRPRTAAVRPRSAPRFSSFADEDLY
jgi:hypothetical protein